MSEASNYEAELTRTPHILVCARHIPKAIHQYGYMASVEIPVSVPIQTTCLFCHNQFSAIVRPL
jgi:hypothetical protein